MNTKQAIIGVGIFLGLAGALYFGAYKFASHETAIANAPPSPSVRLTRPTRDEINVMPNAFVSCDLDLPNTGKGVDAATLTSANVKLLRASDNKEVPAQMNTSGAGDAIVLTPRELLEPSTKYVFQVTSGVKDTGGASFLPYSISFTTAAGSHTENYPVAFDKIALDGTKIQNAYTGMTVGPDGMLYAGTFSGSIFRFPINADGSLGKAEELTGLQAASRGPRTITGIVFDPTSTAGNLKLWVSHSQMAFNQGKIEGADDWVGKISTMSGPSLSEVSDVIVGLPRAWKDHMNFQLAWGKDGALYFSQGSHTSSGAPDKKWNYRPERKLSAAVLRFDPKLAAKLPVDVKTEEGGSYDPAAAGAPLTIYATGVRSGFDILFHRNGFIYVGLNGAAAGGATPGTESNRNSQRIPAINNLTETTDDLLLKIVKDGYYGHPNPTRNEYVLMGGNPTDKPDVEEIASYQVGIKPEPGFVAPAYNFGKSVSPNGLCEYIGPAFGGALDGKILVTRYSGGKDIIVLTPGKDGNIVEAVTGIDGLTQFTEPLDIVEDPKTGNLYVAEFGGQQLALLKPKVGAVSAKVFKQSVNATGAQ